MKCKNVKDLNKAIMRVIPQELQNDDVVFVCVGTDRSTGDALGPLVGSNMKRLGYSNVFGTIDEPVHAVNLKDTLESLPDSKKVIAIDACLGQFSSVGSVDMKKGPLKPGAGVNKELPSVGDYHIAGIVNIGGFMEYFVLQNTRLSMVMKMADMISESLASRFPVSEVMQEAAITTESMYCEI